MNIERYQLNDVYAMRIATFDGGRSIVFPIQKSSKVDYPKITYGNGNFSMSYNYLFLNPGESSELLNNIKKAEEAIERARAILQDRAYEESYER